MGLLVNVKLLMEIMRWEEKLLQNCVDKNDFFFFTNYCITAIIDKNMKRDTDNALTMFTEEEKQNRFI